jgi:hypothetical protein
LESHPNINLGLLYWSCHIMLGTLWILVFFTNFDNFFDEVENLEK